MTRIGVTGHQNIPATILSQVRAGIEQALARSSGEIVGVTALAAGADQLFARAVLKMGGRLHVIVPCKDYESAFSDEEALDSYRELLAGAVHVETLLADRPSSQAFLEAGHRVVDLSDLMIAVWDGQAAQGLGGTADIVRYARERSREVTNVWPPGASR